MGFVCGGPKSILIVPTAVIAAIKENLATTPEQYKLVISDGQLLFPQWAKEKPLDLRPYLNAFHVFEKDRSKEKNLPLSESTKGCGHSEIQGMLLEIGNIRGFETYCPDRSGLFGNRPLGSIASLPKLPLIPGIPPRVAGKVDVIWFREEFPVDAFEVELSTGIWSGLVRLGEFSRLSTHLHVITGDESGSEFDRKIGPYVFRHLVNRCNRTSAKALVKLYHAEQGAANLRREIGW